MVKKELTGYPHIDKPWMKYYDLEVANRKEPKVNMTDYLRLKTTGLDSEIATSYYGKETTYGEFWNKVDTAAKVLKELGIKKYDRVMNLVPNIPESGEIWLGATELGIVSDFIDPRPDSMDLKANAMKVLELIKHEKANHIVALDQCYLAMLKPIENELKDIGIDKIVTLSASDSMNLKGIISYLVDTINYNNFKNEREKDEAIKKLKWYQAVLNKTKAMKNASKAYEEATKTSPVEVVRYSDLIKDVKYTTYESIYEPNLINYIGHTSGTSGARPKPIALTNENQISGTEQLIKGNRSYDVGDRILHILPYFSPLGADNDYILNLACGSNNIEIPEFEINEFGYLLKKYNPNIILATPSWILSLMKCKYLEDIDLSNLKRIVYGGDSMTKEDEEKLNEWLYKHNSPVICENGYGMSEFCGCGSFAYSDYNRYESIGIPLPNTTFAIVNPDIDDKLVPLKLEEGKERILGEIAISSPAVTPGVLDDKVIVPKYELDGKEYIRTRDIAEIDRDGILYFHSRKDRSFTRFDGYKIKPYEIEQVMEENSLIKYTRITPYYDEKMHGIMPKAHIVLEDNVAIEDVKALTEKIIQDSFINNPNLFLQQLLILQCHLNLHLLKH